MLWFTPIGDGSMTIDTAGSRYDTVVAVFTGTPGALTLMNGGCADDSVDMLHLQAQLPNVPVTHNTTYFILVGESPTEIGTQNGSSGGPAMPAVTVAAPLSNDATLFFSLTETPTIAGISFTPVNNTPLSFGSQQVGTTSSSQTVTVMSTGGTPISISGISVPGGFNASGCASPVPQGSSCQISVTFHPTTTGPVAGSLTFTDNVAGSTPSYPLNGAGTDFTFPQPSQGGTPLTSTSPATFNLSVSGSPGFSSPITFACQNLPPNSQPMFSPNPATPGSGGSVAVTLTVSRVSNTASIARTSGTIQIGVGVMFVLMFVAAQLYYRECHFDRRLCAGGITLSCLLFVGACGGGIPPMNPPMLVPPAAGSYPFSVTATVAGAPPKTLTLTLTVQ